MQSPVKPVGRSPLIATRLNAPSADGRSIPRPRLLDQLIHGVGRRLTVIHGPAGFGKTTLAVQLRAHLRGEGKPAAWLSMDKDDNDAARFLAYLVEAIRNAEPSLCADLLSMLESRSEHVADFLLTELVNQLNDYGEDFYLFLDDWHLVSDPRSEAAILFLLEHGPANLHLVVTSRSRPNFPMVTLILRNEVTEIQASDLRFDLQESESFFQGLAIGTADLQALLETTEGWVAALQLAMISLKTSGDQRSLMGWIAGKHHAIGDYLAESVLNSLPSELLEFLLKTSILERFCGSLCSEVTGRANGLAILERAEQLQLFIIPLDEEREWFRFHHLFASHLQRRLERDFPEQIRTLHLTAAAWFESQGLAEEAVTHALSGGDDDYGIRIVEGSAMGFVERSYMATLLGLVSKLPQDKLPARPALQTAIAWSNCLVHRSGAALIALGHVDRYMAQHGISPDDEIALEAKVVRACIEIYADRIDGLEALVRPVLARSESVRPWVAAVAANILTFALLHSHRYGEALDLQKATQPFHLRAQGPFSHIYGHCFAGMAAYEMGQHVAAKGYFREALALAQRQAGQHSHAARLAGAMLGKMFYENNRLAEAETLLEDSVALGVEGGVADYSLASYIYYARLMALRGATDRAIQILEEGRQTATLLGQDRLKASMEAEAARLHLCGVSDGPPPDEEASTEGSPNLPDYSDGIAARVWEARQVARIRLALARKRPREANALLDPLLDYTSLQAQHGLTRTALILRAMALELQGDIRGAESAMVSALGCCDSPRAVRPFLDEGPGVLPVLERLLAPHRHFPGRPVRPTQEHIRRILAVNSHPTLGPDTALPEVFLSLARGASRPGLMAPEPLKEREIEVLRLVGEGLSNKEIARQMGIGVDTVKWYLKSIYGKIGVGRRTQAIGAARRLHLI